MIKKMFISALVIGILGSLLFSGIEFAFAQAEAGCCDESQCGNAYCSDPYNPGPPPTGTFIEPSGTICVCSPITVVKLEDLLANLIDYIFLIATVVMSILILIGGYYFLASGGEYEKVTKAKRILTYTVIGYTIILFAKGIAYTIKSILGQ
jgi:hypothetical protein